MLCMLCYVRLCYEKRAFGYKRLNDGTPSCWLHRQLLGDRPAAGREAPVQRWRLYKHNSFIKLSTIRRRQLPVIVIHSHRFGFMRY